MIRLVLWLWAGWQALRPAEGQPCLWCGRCYTTPPIAARVIGAAELTETMRKMIDEMENPPGTGVR